MVAEAFHVLPSIVARDLDSDPEMLSLKVLPLLRYAEAYHVLKHADSKDTLKSWAGSKVMEEVKRNTFELHKERVKRRRGSDSRR